MILILILLTYAYSHAAITWTKEWSNQDDLTNDFGGDDLEDIQDDIDTQAIISSNNLTLTGNNTFSGTSTFSGSVTTSAAQTFSGTVNFNGGFNIDQGTIAVGSFTIDTTTASGTQAVTGVGFQPKGVIFLANQASSVEASWGLDDSETHRCLYDNDASSDGTYELSILQSITGVQGSGIFYEGYVSSFDSDGFTITWTKTGATADTLTVNYIAFLI